MIDFLCLAIGRIRPADVRSFVPAKPEPLQSCDDVFRVGFIGALFIRVLQAQNEFAFLPARVEIVIKSSASGADMQVACRTGSNSYSDIVCHKKILKPP